MNRYDRKVVLGTRERRTLLTLPSDSRELLMLIGMQYRVPKTTMREAHERTFVALDGVGSGDDIYTEAAAAYLLAAGSLVESKIVRRHDANDPAGNTFTIALRLTHKGYRLALHLLDAVAEDSRTELLAALS